MTREPRRRVRPTRLIAFVSVIALLILPSQALAAGRVLLPTNGACDIRAGLNAVTWFSCQSFSGKHRSSLTRLTPGGRRTVIDVSACRRYSAPVRQVIDGTPFLMCGAPNSRRADLMVVRAGKANIVLRDISLADIATEVTLAGPDHSLWLLGAHSIYRVAPSGHATTFQTPGYTLRAWLGVSGSRLIFDAVASETPGVNEPGNTIGAVAQDGTTAWQALGSLLPQHPTWGVKDRFLTSTSDASGNVYFPVGSPNSLSGRLVVLHPDGSVATSPQTVHTQDLRLVPRPGPSAWLVTFGGKIYSVDSRDANVKLIRNGRGFPLFIDFPASLASRFDASTLQSKGRDQTSVVRFDAAGRTKTLGSFRLPKGLDVEAAAAATAHLLWVVGFERRGTALHPLPARVYAVPIHV